MKKPTMIRVCNGKTCGCRQAKQIMAAVEQVTGLAAGGQNDDYDVDYRSCTGYCERANNVVVDDTLIYQHAQPATIMSKIRVGLGLPYVKLPPKDINVDELLEL